MCTADYDDAEREIRNAEERLQAILKETRKDLRDSSIKFVTEYLSNLGSPTHLSFKGSLTKTESAINWKLANPQSRALEDCRTIMNRCLLSKTSWQYPKP